MAQEPVSAARDALITRLTERVSGVRVKKGFGTADADLQAGPVVSVKLMRARAAGCARQPLSTVDGGNVHVSAATVESGALRMDDLRVAAGLVSLTMTHVEDGRMSLDGARVEGGAVRFEGLAVDRRADVSWGPFDPVEPLPGPERTGRRDLDLRGPAPVDRWAWLRHEPADHDVTTPARPPRQDVPSRTGRAAS